MQQWASLLFQALWLLPLASALPVLRTVARGSEGSLRGGSRGDAVALLQSQRQSRPQISSLGSDDNHHASEGGALVQELSYDPLYFGLMIDAGSTGSRVRMFRWTLRTKVDLMEIIPLDVDEDRFEIKPGLSAYGDDPEGAVPPLAGILKAAEKYIPKSVWHETVLFLKATAGMRLLERNKAQQVMSTVREFLSDPDKCSFKFVSADIISGEQEAVFAYLTTNYNLGTLASPRKTAGALELGGSSMQVIFRPGEDIQDNEFQFYLGGQRQSVYAKSYLKFGLDGAMERMLQVLVGRNANKTEVESPCHNPGFKEEIQLSGGKKRTFVGTGNSTSCREVIRKVMGLDIECLLPPCAMFGAYMTPVQGDFYAFAGFFYAVHGLGLVGWKDTKALTLDEIVEATESFCTKDLQYAQKESGEPMHYAKTFCFMGNYVYQTLQVFGFQDSKSSVIFSRKLTGFNLGWPAGAMLYETHLMPLSLTPSDSIRGLCGPPALFGKPPESKGAAEKLGFSMLSIAVVALMMSLFCDF